MLYAVLGLVTTQTVHTPSCFRSRLQFKFYENAGTTVVAPTENTLIKCKNIFVKLKISISTAG